MAQLYHLGSSGRNTMAKEPPHLQLTSCFGHSRFFIKASSHWLSFLLSQYHSLPISLSLSISSFSLLYFLYCLPVLSPLLEFLLFYQSFSFLSLFLSGSSFLSHHLRSSFLAHRIMISPLCLLGFHSCVYSISSFLPGSDHVRCEVQPCGQNRKTSFRQTRHCHLPMAKVQCQCPIWGISSSPRAP